MNKLAELNRFEVIDSTSVGKGRELVKWELENFIVEYDLQDTGRTLKILISDAPKKKVKK